MDAPLFFMSCCNGWDVLSQDWECLRVGCRVSGRIVISCRIFQRVQIAQYVQDAF